MPVDADFVTRYATPPTKTTMEQVVSAHTSIRDLLGANYSTLLQGSYKNDTALSDINDVDIVALDLHPGATWQAIFGRIEAILQGSPHYAGKWTRGDKCIRVNTRMKVDIVPAIGTADRDPIKVFSFSKNKDRQNWPRGHYESGAAKSRTTNGHFKQSVRLFKRWAKCWFPGTKVAPSYYIECALHARPDSDFSGDLAATFERIASGLAATSYRSTRLPRIAGDGDLFTAEEWGSAEFSRFQNQLTASLEDVRAARTARDVASGRQAWTRAFNGYTG